MVARSAADITLPQYTFYATHLARCQLHFDAMRMDGGLGEDPLHNALGSLTRALIRFLHNRTRLADLNRFAIVAIWRFTSTQQRK